MSNTLIYSKTAKGMLAVTSRSKGLRGKPANILKLVNGQLNEEELLAKSGIPWLELRLALTKLESDGYIKTLESAPLTQFEGDLGSAGDIQVSVANTEAFHDAQASMAAIKAENERVRQEIEETEQILAEINAESDAQKEALQESHAEPDIRKETLQESHAKDQVERESRRQRRLLARARDEAEARARAEAEEKAQAQAKMEAKELSLQMEAEASAKEEAAQKAREEALAQRELARHEAESRAKAEAEAEAEALARQAAADEAREIAAQLAQEAEKALVEAQAQREALARIKAEEDERTRQALETQAREAAAQKLRDEEEAQARIKAELEAELRARREAEAKARADAKAQSDADDLNRLVDEAIAKENRLQMARDEAKVQTDFTDNAQTKATAPLKSVSFSLPELSLPAFIPHIRWGRAVATFFVAMLLLPPLVIQLVSWGGFIPRVEQIATESLGEPVTIGGLHTALWPLPHLRLEGVRIGPDVNISVVRVIPILSTLFDDTRTFKLIEADTLRLDPNILSRMPAWLGAHEHQKKVAVRAIALKNVTLEVKNIPLPSLNAAIRLTHAGAFEYAKISNMENSFEANFSPGKGGLDIEVTALSWKPPLGPKIRLDNFLASASTSHGGIRFSEIGSSFYGGSAKGSATLTWSSGWRADGVFTFSGVDVEAAAPAFVSGVPLSGRLKMDVSYTLSGRSLDTLFDAPRIKADFMLENGTIGNIDLTQLIQSDGPEAAKGMPTRFSTLSGKLNLGDARYQFRDLKMTAGLLSVRGSADVQPEQKLSGVLDAVLKSSSSPISSHLKLSGTINAPLIQRSGFKRAVASSDVAQELETAPQ